MSIAILLLQTGIAIMGVFLLWPKNPPHFKRALIVGIAIAWIGDATLESVQRHKTAIEQAKFATSQQEVKGDLDIVRAVIERDSRQKAAVAAEHLQARVIIGTLIRQGIAVKNSCSDPQMATQNSWMQKCERDLGKIDPTDVIEFEESETDSTCYERVDIELGALRSILHKYD